MTGSRFAMRRGLGPAIVEALPMAALGLGVAGLLLVIGGLLLPASWAQELALIAGLGLAFAACLLTGLRWFDKVRDRELVALAGDIIAPDEVPKFVCRGDFRILKRNEAAQKRFGEADLMDCLGEFFASPQAMVDHLMQQLRSAGEARQTAPTKSGSFTLELNALGPDLFLWRLEPSELQVRSDGANLAAFSSGPDGSILSFTPELEQLIGRKPRKIGEIFSEEPLEGAIAHLEGAEGPFQVALHREPGIDGETVTIVIPVEADTLGAAIGVEWDVIENLPVPLLKLGALGQVLGSNRSARALLRCEIGDGAPLSDYLDGLGRPIRDWIAEARRARTRPEFLRGTGAQRDLFVQVALCPALVETADHVIAVLHDVTEFKVLEAQFVQSQKMQAIGQLAGGVAHDFNNLLTAINGHCDLLLLRHAPGDPDHADLTQIHQNTNRAAALVGQLLAFSRKQDLQMELLDLRDTLADLTHLLNRLVGERVELVLQHYPRRLFLMADKRQFEQVILNLVVNARDAMDDVGTIMIETQMVMLTEPLHRDRATVPAGSYALVQVRDEGRGIAPELIGHVFEPFYTTKQAGEGTGLGLSTVYGIVKQTGGFVFVDSSPGEGTVFSLYFPARERAKVEPEKPSEEEDMTPAAVPRGAGVVLLVEDEAPVRAFASRALKLRGYDVVEADCGEAALDLLSDGELHVDLIVSDVVMPGIDGPTWVSEALKTRSELKVVFMSGYSEEGMRENRAAIPSSVFLPKPFSLEDLLSTVQAQIAPD